MPAAAHAAIEAVPVGIVSWLTAGKLQLQRVVVAEKAAAERGAVRLVSARRRTSSTVRRTSRGMRKATSSLPTASAISASRSSTRPAGSSSRGAREAPSPDNSPPRAPLPSTHKATSMSPTRETSAFRSSTITGRIRARSRPSRIPTRCASRRERTSSCSLRTPTHRATSTPAAKSTR